MGYVFKTGTFRDLPAVESAVNLQKMAQPKGIDVSSHQGDVNWDTVVANGVSFAYIKATEGASKHDGMVIVYSNDIAFQATRTHISLPSTPVQRKPVSSVAVTTLPVQMYPLVLTRPNSSPRTAEVGPAMASPSRVPSISNVGSTYLHHPRSPHLISIICRIDNPYGATCYGLSADSMVSWIRDFSDTYHSLVGRYPVIYTTTNWWTTCTGNKSGFGSTNPLWIARYAGSPGALPAGWSYHTFWQYADSGPSAGDQNYFNGDMAGLKR